jgi:hypothetical protein
MVTRHQMRALAAAYIHPIKIQIIEALGWIDLPMSPSDLERVFGGKPPVSTIAYHVKSLADSGVVKALEKEPGRQGKTKTPYRLAAPFLN